MVLGNTTGSQMIKTWNFQVLDQSRKNAIVAQLLAPDKGIGPYKERFWSHVALPLPGRRNMKCLKAFHAFLNGKVARFWV